MDKFIDENDRFFSGKVGNVVVNLRKLLIAVQTSKDDTEERKISKNIYANTIKKRFLLLCQQSFSLASELKEPYDSKKIEEINTKLNNAFILALGLLDGYNSKDFEGIKSSKCDEVECSEILKAINDWISTLTSDQQKQKQVQSVKGKIDNALNPSTSSVASTSGSQAP